MATNLALDDTLIEEARRTGGHKTKKQAVTGDYEEAALANNRCRAKGVCGSLVDFLICAAGMRRNWPVLTTDKDFAAYARVPPVRPYAPRATG